MLTLAGVSASARPFVISGIALAMPPVPVLVPTPAPVRRNHSSSVKFVRVQSRRRAERHVLARAVQLQRARRRSPTASPSTVDGRRARPGAPVSTATTT